MSQNLRIVFTLVIAFGLTMVTGFTASILGKKRLEAAAAWTLLVIVIAGGLTALLRIWTQP